MTNPYQEFGERTGKTVLFAHANGFPPSTYHALLTQLGKDCHILAPHLRPLWQTLSEFRSQASERSIWHQMAEDQNAFIEAHDLAPVTYIGHSMGANVGVLAANLKPHLYKQLILVEPVFLRKKIFRLIRFAPNFLIKRAPIVAKALGRPDRFESLQSAFDFHRSKRVFSGLTDEVLWHYINAAIVPDEDEVTLLYTKYWEALMYASVPNVWPYLKQCKVPISVLRGELSDTVDDVAWKRWRRLKPKTLLPQHTRAINFADAGHLLPLEKPQELAQQIIKCKL